MNRLSVLLWRLPNLKPALDEAQQRAVTYGEGPLLVTAGPGSGKTTVITHHIKYLIEHLGISPNKILVITFTKAAATEMKERFLRLMNANETEVVFGTFHAFFYRIVSQSFGFDHQSILNEKEKIQIIKEILRAQKIYFYDDSFLADILNEISRVQNKDNPEQFESVLLPKEVFLMVYNEYIRRKQILRKLDFDDMITLCFQLLKKDAMLLKKWQSMFQYILLDEFQDINPLQYEIMKLLSAEHQNVFAVGDEDQSIYSFRGADPKICFQFLKDYKNAKQIYMTTNYRCREEIVEAAKRLISHNKNRFAKEIHAVQKEKTDKNNPIILCGQKDMGIKEESIFAGIVCRQFTTEAEEYEAIAQSLKEMQIQGKLKQCAILCRTNTISPLFLSQLKKNKIPYLIKNSCKNWKQSAVVQDIFSYIALAEGDLSRKHFYRVMNKPVRYISREMISKEDMTWEKFIENAKGNITVVKNIYKLRCDLEYIRSLPLFACIGYIRRGIGYENWLKTQGNKVCMEGMEALELLQALAKECETTEEIKDLIEVSREETRDISRNDSVSILTYHGAKGLEWPYVFLPDVMNGITPYQRAKKEEEVEEERRMFYVAVTRAKEAVCLFCLKKDETHKKSPSIFIEELKGES